MEANEAKVIQKIEEDKHQILRETEEIRKKMRFLEEEERKLDMEISQTKRHKHNPPAASPITFADPTAMMSPTSSLPEFRGGMAMMMFSTPGPATAAKRTGSRTSDLGSGSKKYRQHQHHHHQAPSKVAGKFGRNFF